MFQCNVHVAVQTGQIPMDFGARVESHQDPLAHYLLQKVPWAPYELAVWFGRLHRRLCPKLIPRRRYLSVQGHYQYLVEGRQLGVERDQELDGEMSSLIDPKGRLACQRKDPVHMLKGGGWERTVDAVVTLVGFQGPGLEGDVDSKTPQEILGRKPQHGLQRAHLEPQCREALELEQELGQERPTGNELAARIADSPLVRGPLVSLNGRNAAAGCCVPRRDSGAS